MDTTLHSAILLLMQRLRESDYYNSDTDALMTACVKVANRMEADEEREFDLAYEATR